MASLIVEKVGSLHIIEVNKYEYDFLYARAYYERFRFS
ncbi:hypothetical protein SATMO3_06560 [Sporomusa aerivorans]